MRDVLTTCPVGYRSGDGRCNEQHGDSNQRQPCGYVISSYAPLQNVSSY
ncbi:hypothetical protein [Citrobacter pasteurii]|nr:hypothetical protein SF123566_8462 [Shigella flexneri 1235-66]CEJ67019.1 hypothetical protein [Citrobacter pasteurii]